MADIIFSASAEPICFSDAIISELSLEVKHIVLPAAATLTHEDSNIVSDALITEIERNVENGTMSRFDLQDKCVRFSTQLFDFKLDDGEKGKILLTVPEAFSDDDDEVRPKSLIAKPVTKRGGVYKKVLRSIPKNCKRNYVWKQPLKNKARLHKRLRPAKVSDGIERRENTTPPLKRSHDVLDDGDDTKELSDGTDGEESGVPDVDENSQEGEETDKEVLFVPAHTPPLTTRKLAIVVRRNMDALYSLAGITPGKPESVCGFELALRQAVDKVRFRDAGDLTPEEIVTLHEAMAQVEYNKLAVNS